MLTSTKTLQTNNLAGIPAPFLKILTRGYDNGKAGENSLVELFKDNAKQRDVTAGAKFIGNYVKESERSTRYSRRNTRGEDAAEQRSKDYAGCLVKVNGEFKFMVQYNNYTEDGGNFELITDRGASITRKIHSYSRYGGNQTFDSRSLKAGDLSYHIDFDQHIEVYLVTTDNKRSEIHNKRIISRTLPKINPAKQKALVKYMRKQSNGTVGAIQLELQNELKKINNTISNMITDASKGDYQSSGNFEDLIKGLKEKYEIASTIAYNINGVVKEGTIFDEYSRGRSDRDSKNYHYQRYMEAIETLNNKND